MKTLSFFSNSSASLRPRARAAESEPIHMHNTLESPPSECPSEAKLSRAPRGWRVSLLALASAFAVAAAGCTDVAEDDSIDEGGQSAFTGTPNKDIGQLFMIEHFGVEPSGYADVRSWIARRNLGALILWNPSEASGEVVRQMASAYAEAAKASGTPELFISADQEGRGTQRFDAQNGFSNLVDGTTLGRIVARDKSARVCELHGRITAREMASAGMNMSLGTVSDIFTADSGTPGMFRKRAVSADPAIVSLCISAMAKGYAAERHVVFVTKHFPGLGNASGNTDVDANVHSFSDTAAESERELAPYRTTIGAVNQQPGASALFGAMISHASYALLDKSKTPATLSPVILNDVLRQKMTFRGLTVSDAFWTWGATRGLPAIAKQRLMARALLAGMDVLMIAKADFTGAWDYFQMLNAGTLPQAELTTLAKEAGIADIASLQARFRARLAESAKRIKESKDAVGKLATYRGTGAANSTSAELIAEYQKLTK